MALAMKKPGRRIVHGSVESRRRASPGAWNGPDATPASTPRDDRSTRCPTPASSAATMALVSSAGMSQPAETTKHLVDAGHRRRDRLGPSRSPCDGLDAQPEGLELGRVTDERPHVQPLLHQPPDRLCPPTLPFAPMTRITGCLRIEPAPGAGFRVTLPWAYPTVPQFRRHRRSPETRVLSSAGDGRGRRAGVLAGPLRRFEGKTQMADQLVLAAGRAQPLGATHRQRRRQLLDLLRARHVGPAPALRRPRRAAPGRR